MQRDYVTRAIRLALEEDIGTGDVTSAVTVPAGARASGHFLAKSPGVVSGLDVAAATFREVDPRVAFIALVRDGDRVVPGDLIARVAGEARSLLAAERVALNFLQRLSGVATATARYAEAVTGTGARVIDTRKTTPGMRLMEKAAVRHGGGHNHRFGLSDGILIKDNHLAAIGGPDRVARAVAAARAGAPHTLRVEVEVTSLDELEQALAAGADVVLLDNMAVDQMAEAVRRTRGRAILEASGGITLETIRRIAETGVDLISVGALTHSAPSLDISLELTLETGDATGE
ncbi:MAG TPA: carboxylating nicotinate-nucleotide diphosphorylase [Thermomicrobiaceae bacterium]|nr:carboxylating nicotinate-nucleotide diphosphorylase [Thermomicrobiaceae bacterium]